MTAKDYHNIIVEFLLFMHTKEILLCGHDGKYNYTPASYLPCVDEFIKKVSNDATTN